jgi:hypothetical protein
MRLMTALRWTTGETGPLLAAAWGMAATSIAEIAGEASRRIRSAMDPATVKELVCDAMREGLAIALADRDARGLAAVAKVYADVSGASAPQKHELTGKDGAPLGLPPRAAILFESAKAGNVEAQRLLEAWLAGDEPDAPALPEPKPELQ